MDCVLPATSRHLAGSAQSSVLRRTLGGVCPWGRVVILAESPGRGWAEEADAGPLPLGVNYLAYSPSLDRAVIST